MALKKQLFAAAVSQGLDPRMVATWFPDLPRTPRVLVPIQVDALVVRAAGGAWADCRMRDPNPDNPEPIDAGELLPEPFAELPEPRPRGVHLHWALPDALTRGVGSAPPDDATDEERERLNNVTFPAIPDRWLVVRIGGASRAGATRVGSLSLTRRAVTAWVIESGGMTPTVTPIDQWTEPGPESTRPRNEEGAAAEGNRPRRALTALGNGDPAWAAYYDNVANRLGFHDALAGVDNGPLAYLVCGWFSDPARDALGDSITSVVAFEQRLNELRWELPAGSYGQARASYERVRNAALIGLDTREAYAMPRVQEALKSGGLARFDAAKALEFEGIAQAAPLDREGRPVGGYHHIVDSWWPKYTLLHGGVVGIGWPQPGIPVAPSGLLGSQVGGPPAAGNVKVAIGHSLTDALAAMLAANNRTPAEARALEAALLGAADELDETDAAARIDVRVHAANFGALPGGFETETIAQRPPTAPPRSPDIDPSKTDPGIFRDVLPKEKVGGGKTTGFKAQAETKFTGSTSVETRDNAKLAGVKVKVGAKLNELITDVGFGGKPPIAPAPPEPDPEPVPVEVKRALPRFFIPSDPVILLQGTNRSFKHGGDGRFSEKGKLPCRVSDMMTRELAPRALRDLPGGGRFRGADVLDRGLANGSVPPECDHLLAELAVLDPGSATYAARATGRAGARMTTAQVNRAARTYAVEQTVWWATRDPKRDVAPLAAMSGLSGYLPCPMAVSPPVTPWVPLHLDWEIEYIGHELDGWELGEIDFDAQADRIPAAGEVPAGIVLRGRALLTAGAAQTAAAAVRQTLERAQRTGGSASLTPRSVEQYHSHIARVLLDEVANIKVRGVRADDPDELRSLADALAEMDVLAGALDRFHTRLRGGFVADGDAKPAEGDPAPAPFIALRAGFLRIRRLRLVDCFGQILDLAASSAEQTADMTQIVRSEPMSVAGRADLIELAPRFTAPTRLLLRFIGSDNEAEEARGEVSPVCGFLLPDHLDAELQFHAVDGAGIGAVRFDRAAGVLWEDAPGRPGTVGASPARAIANAHLAGIAQGLLDWGTADTTREDPARDTALSALLRLIDTTLWTVDPFGHTGDEHMSLLIGHPVAVLRARLTLEIDEPIDPDRLAAHRVPVRIGSLAQWQDGLLGYYVDDDYHTLHIADPAIAGFARPLGPGEGFLQSATRTSSYYQNFADDIGVAATEGASPVAHDFVDTSGVLFLRPGQTVLLTLLLEPHSAVHVTSGIVPRKALGMRREWIASGLANIAPTFRFGPVLVDPKRIRMPVASELRGTWSWCHRVDATTWKEDEVVNATGDAQLPRDPVEGQEGWLKLTPEKPSGGGAP